MVREGPAQPAPYRADQARNEIVTHTWRRRAIVLGGLIGVVVLVWLTMWLR